MWVHDLADADAACGGKALGLARLIRAGLPVPPGFAIDDRAFRHVVGDLTFASEADVGHVLGEAARRLGASVATAPAPPTTSPVATAPASASTATTAPAWTSALPAELVREVERRAAALGTVIVRSSATIEDGDAGAAAGVFSSSSPVHGAEVWDAIRGVWLSALTPLAATYALRRGGRIAIGVIVQTFVPGERVTIYTRPPGAPTADEVLVQRGSQLTREARAPEKRGPSPFVAPTRSVEPKRGPSPFVAPAVSIALRAEEAIGARDGADVELVLREGGDRSLVQARPIVHPVAAKRTPVPAPVLRALIADGRRWTWDVTHNPDPLSTAQAELVALVDRAGIGPEMRVCAGYLYTAARRDAAAALPDVRDREEVIARVADIEARLAAQLDAPTKTLRDALDHYVAAIAIWANELSPLVRALPRVRGAHRPSAVETTLAAAARGELTEAEVLARVGVMAPAWDVAVPTYAERPVLVRDAIARASHDESRGAPDSHDAADAHAAADAREVPAPRDALHELAADLAERDDVWFAKAQWMVRRALLARADELGVAREDVGWLRFEVLEQGIAPEEARRQAAGARAAAERASRWDMPLVVPEPAEARAGHALHGVGTGPRVTGRVVRFASLGAAIAVRRGDIVVARAVTPALAVLVIGCAALVSETGGLLDHGAALARELGVPCVVGCRDAWSRLADGMLVTVDGDRGRVELVGED